MDPEGIPRPLEGATYPAGAQTAPREGRRRPGGAGAPMISSRGAGGSGDERGTGGVYSGHRSSGARVRYLEVDASEMEDRLIEMEDRLIGLEAAQKVLLEGMGLLTSQNSLE